MNTEFMQQYGFYIIAALVLISILILSVKIVILDRVDGEPLSIGKVTMALMVTMLSAFSLSLFKFSLDKPEEFNSEFEKFWNSIDWSFWGYYVLLPFCLTLLIIWIRNSLQTNK